MGRDDYQGQGHLVRILTRKSKLVLWLTKVVSIGLVALQDGVPIHGPYGRDGRLVDVNELDECNGRWEMNASGEKDDKV